MKNITFSAPEELIEKARDQAKRQGTTLNELFRRWLQQQATKDSLTPEQYREILQSLSYVNAGRKFSREEMNER